MCPMFLNQTKLWKKPDSTSLTLSFNVVKLLKEYLYGIVCLFVCLGCLVHHYLWRSTKFDLYLTYMANEQWGLLWHMVTPYNGNPRQNLTPIPVVEYLADRDSNPNLPNARRMLYHYATAAVYLYGEIYVFTLIFRIWYNKKIMMIILQIFNEFLHSSSMNSIFLYTYIFLIFFFDSIGMRGVHFYYIVSNYHININIIDSI